MAKATKIQEINTFDQLLETAKSNDENWMTTLTKLSKEKLEGFRVGTFLSRISDDIRRQIELLKAQIEDQSEKTLDLAYNIKDYANRGEAGRLDFATSLMGILSDTNDKEEKIERWEKVSTYFKA